MRDDGPDMTEMKGFKMGQERIFIISLVTLLL